MNRVVAFDVFDTLVTRAVGAPTSVFLLLAHRCRSLGLVHCAAAEFAEARIGAEKDARLLGLPEREVTLSEIYAALAIRLWLTAKQAESVMAQECRLEAELLRVVPVARQRLEEARRSGSRVIYISDMYLPAEWISQQLAVLGLRAADETCYVSSQHRVCKSTGGLFDVALRKEKLRPPEMVHMGNNLLSDVKVPRRLGIRTLPVLDSNPNRYESLLESHAASSNGLASLLAGASRLARLSIPVQNPRDAAVRDVAAGVAGPAIVGYVIWILREAEAAGIRRLYFVSRDGEILLDAARRLAPKLGVTCDLRYLYGSRQAWHLPSVTDIGDHELSWICERQDFLCLEGLLARVNISPEEIAGELASLGFPRTSWWRDLTTAEIAAIRSALSKDELRRLVLRKAAEARPQALAYLRQEGLSDAVPWAIVDLGWLGRMQTSLAAILPSESPSVRGFYFGVRKKSGIQPVGRLDGYLFDGQKRQLIDKSLVQVTTLMETFCSGSHGLVLGYQSSQGAVSPLLKSQHNGPVVAWGLPLVHATIQSFAEHLWLPAQSEVVQGDVRDAIRAVLAEFWLRPTRTEARAWGTFPYEDSQTGATSFSLARVPSLRDSIKYLITGRRKWFWHEGARQAASLGVRCVLRCAEAIRRPTVAIRQLSRRSVRKSQTTA